MMTNKEEVIKRELIEKIVLKEYDMFSCVENIGERAPCQDDFHTFYIMRFAQHSIFGINTLKQYLEDIREAIREKRNLVAEKYSWMMEETDPVYFAKELKPYLPEVSAQKMKLVAAMTTVFMTCYELVRQRCPKLLEAGRNPYENVAGASICLYFSSELKTWSEDTLIMACRDIIGHLERKCNPVGMIYETIIDFYDYSVANMNAEDKIPL